MNKRNIEDVYRLSPTQRGLLVESLGAADMYVDQIRSDVEGPLDADRLRAAFQALTARHAALRTSFHTEGLAEPVQVVRRSAEFPFTLHDWSHLPAAEAAARAEALLEEDRARGFDLAAAPLMRLTVVRTGDLLHRLAWSFHHIILDGWSLGMLLQEAFALYDGLVRGDADPAARLPAPPRPYREFVSWQRTRPQAEAEAFWRAALDGVTGPTSLEVVGADHAAPAVGLGNHRLHLSTEATAALDALCRRHQLTLGTVALGAWSILLSRYSGERSVIFGTVASGRPADLPGVERMVGVFINTVPVRARVPAGAAVLPWLRELQEWLLESRGHEHYPLADIQRWSGMPPGVGLFETLVLFQNYPRARTEALAGAGGGLRFRDLSDVERTNYPLRVEAVPGPRLELTAANERSRFDDGTAVRVLGHLRALLEGIAAAPESRVDDLPLLDPAEERRLRLEWNDTDRPTPPVGTVARFQEQAARTPDRPAVRCGARVLTYRELNERANRLARVLEDVGVGPEVMVGLLAERGCDFVVTVLGVLKAGGAYLPLDPYHPLERHLQVIAEGTPPLVLLEGGVSPELEAALEAAEAPARPVRLEELHALASALPAEAAADLPERAGAGNLAYVIFTSGSTGRPKGAMVEHRGMLNHLEAKLADLALTGDDRVAQNASQCFDISVWQLLAALLVGGEVVVYPDEVAHDAARLAARAEEDGITIFETVPSMLRLLLEEVERGGTAGRFPRLRWMIPTGEALPPELCRDWFAAFPGVPLLNAYGPTECSDDVTHCALTGPPAPTLRQMPIGRPVMNMRMYVLDAAGRLLPEGLAGELYVGGVGVGRGYRNAPARTAAAFVPDPFAGAPGARMYRTGDRVCWLSDGNLRFLGRLDHQVKIRGFRIELGEVESALRREEGIRDAVAVVREVRPGDQRLVAYVVPEAGAEAAASGLKRSLARRLPGYMVPAAVVVLDALPLTDNGKVDRRALPEPELHDAGSEADYVAPATPVEEALAVIWAGLLEVERVGTRDDFFALGGHSLLATRLIAAVRERLAADLGLRDVFEAPTIALLAERIDAAKASGAAPERPALRAVAREVRRVRRPVG